MKDKTLADYIKRATEQIQKQDQVWHNRNVWNEPELAKQDREAPEENKLLPPDDGTDRPLNPYGQH